MCRKLYRAAMAPSGAVCGLAAARTCQAAPRDGGLAMATGPLLSWLRWSCDDLAVPSTGKGWPVASTAVLGLHCCRGMPGITRTIRIWVASALPLYNKEVFLC